MALCPRVMLHEALFATAVNCRAGAFEINNGDCQKYETGSQIDMEYQHRVVTPHMPKMLVDVLSRFVRPVLLIVAGRVLLTSRLTPRARTTSSTLYIHATTMACRLVGLRLQPYTHPRRSSSKPRHNSVVAKSTSCNITRGHDAMWASRLQWFIFKAPALQLNAV